jgi:hypothetical protein
MPPMLMSFFGVLYLELKKPFWVNPSLGGTIKNHLKEWLGNQKWTNHFLGPFPLNVFKTINCFFSHVYLLHALIYGLKFILEQKKVKIVKKLYS